mmetsp:Transcript_4618/g.13264  ORF Transcript_4618/g.13264 Transcript_4618/m.13264 type:complete len:721 (-) Transcript_4618:1058-3220(-)
MKSGQDILPQCAVCYEALGSYGGPVSLPCGHNGCLQCMASVQRRRPECPLCRAVFPADLPLTINGELRDLVALAATLHTVEEVVEGSDSAWQALAGTQMSKPQKGQAGYDPVMEGNSSDDSETGCVALVPPAPPIHCDLDAVRGGGGDLLSLEPPTWVPDSHAGACTTCSQPFRPWARGRHHCRLCGKIFCSMCCSQRVLLPPKFRAPEPERACEECALLLEPLQPFLAGTISRAVQPVVRDVTDASCRHSWLNPPLAAGGLPGDIYKAANIAAAFRKVGGVAAERRIPAVVLRGAAGFAILSMAKVGLGWSCGVGSGLVVARREDDTWGPPSAVAAVTAGWGLQVGGELTDLLIVLRSPAAVSAFCGTFAAGLGGGASIAAGPLGRQADAGVTLGRRGAALCYSYSLTRGAYAGVAVEGTLISTRDTANLAFYGRPHSPRTLLCTADVPPPAAASALYQALDELLAWAEALPQSPGFLTDRSIVAHDGGAAVAAPRGGLLGAAAKRRRHRSCEAAAGVSLSTDHHRSATHAVGAETTSSAVGQLASERQHREACSGWQHHTQHSPSHMAQEGTGWRQQGSSCLPAPLEASFHADEGWEGSDLPLPALDGGEGDVSAHGSAVSSLHEGYGGGSLFGHGETPRGAGQDSPYAAAEHDPDFLPSAPTRPAMLVARLPESLGGGSIWGARQAAASEGVSLPDEASASEDEECSGDGLDCLFAE